MFNFKTFKMKIIYYEIIKFDINILRIKDIILYYFVILITKTLSIINCF